MEVLRFFMQEVLKTIYDKDWLNEWQALAQVSLSRMQYFTNWFYMPWMCQLALIILFTPDHISISMMYTHPVVYWIITLPLEKQHNYLL